MHEVDRLVKFSKVKQNDLVNLASTGHFSPKVGGK
jgi:hypothetical protein